MRNGVIAAVVALVVIAGLGLWFVSSQNKVSAPSTTSDTQMTQSIAPEASTDEMASDSAMMGAVQEVTVTGSPFKFAPSTITVKVNQPVKLTFKNANGSHDWVVDGLASTKVIGSGEEETITFTPTKTGSFEYYCSVSNHRAMGMTGTLIVE